MRIIINPFRALREYYYFVISGYFVISDFVITGVHCKLNLGTIVLVMKLNSVIMCP